MIQITSKTGIATIMIRITIMTKITTLKKIIIITKNDNKVAKTNAKSKTITEAQKTHNNKKL